MNLDNYLAISFVRHLDYRDTDKVYPDSYGRVYYVDDGYLRPRSYAAQIDDFPVIDGYESKYADYAVSAIFSSIDITEMPLRMETQEGAVITNNIAGG